MREGQVHPLAIELLEATRLPTEGLRRRHRADRHTLKRRSRWS